MKTLATLAVLLLISLSAQAETIVGHACYRYDDSETLEAARSHALVLARQNAIKEYPVVAEVTTLVEGTPLQERLVASLAASVLSGIEIVDEHEDARAQVTCRTITAHVQPMAAIEHILAEMNAAGPSEFYTPTGLPENGLGRVMEAVTLSSDQRATVVIIFECKRNAGTYVDTDNLLQHEMFYTRLTWIDRDGLPQQTREGAGHCVTGHNVGSVQLPLPPWDDKYWIELPDPARNFSRWGNP